MSEIKISHTYNGRVRISTFSYWQSIKISFLLMFRYGFLRRGVYIPPITDEAVYPSYYRGRLKIESGWDNWGGYDWFASNTETDTFLENFFAKHCI